MAKGDFADVGGNYDETLLQQGDYGKWFWSQMSSNARSFLRAPKNWTSDNAEFRCHKCKQTKPAIDFTKHAAGTTDTHHRKCNSCVLGNVKSQGEPRRWETTQTPKWMDQAACKDADPEVFFPESAEEFKTPWAQWRRYCTDCPVAALCEQFGEESYSLGVFGGKLFVNNGSRSIRKVQPDARRRGRPRKDT